MPESATELGTFLRLRREQLRPEDVGLPANGRRRTPGLRREEVAALAGVSIDYLVRLEQGRDRNPSGPVVASLASALRLHGDELKHLHKLAACASSPDSCPTADGPADVVPDTVRTLIERLHPTPAVLLGPWFQVLAHNDAWARFAGPLGMLDGDEPNFARFTFLDRRARQVFAHWDDLADEQVTALRDTVIRWREDDRVQDLIAELEETEAFAGRWRAPGVSRSGRRTTVVHHPDVGDLRLRLEPLLVTDGSDQRLVTWLADDDATEAALHRLLASPLRVVG